MKSLASIILAALALSAQASEGLDAIRARQKTMKHIERPVAQRMDNGNMISVYADDSVKTQAVRLVRMAPKTSDKVAELVQDKERLKSAKALVKHIKVTHGDKLNDLSDSEIITASEAVFDTTKKDAATGAAVGLLLGAAALAVGKTKKGK